MKQKRVLSVVGTRPEAIKMAPVIRALRAEDRISSIVCSSGQHREMLDGVFRSFGIEPDIELDVMKEHQDLTDITCAVLPGVRRVIREFGPNIVMAQGDTTTTMASSLASYYARLPFWHVEAGLRSGDNYSPWPEEVNRRIAGVIAGFHLAPTDKARRNLLDEGVKSESILITGNTVVDALLEVKRRIRNNPSLNREMRRQFGFLGSLERSGNSARLLLVTGHRRESFGAGFEKICLALRTLAERRDVSIVYPVHLNPNVREPVKRILGSLPNVNLIEPLDYVPFVYLMDQSYMILTDSGGIQEEAPSLGKPVLVMRDVTERSEGIEAGVVRLVGTETDRIVNETTRLLDDKDEYNAMSRACNPYGDGHASERIVDAILSSQT